MAVVNTREKLLWAKEIIVRWWRGERERKKRRVARMAEARQRTRSGLIKPVGIVCGDGERADRGKHTTTRASLDMSLDPGGHGDADIWLNL